MKRARRKWWQKTVKKKEIGACAFARKRVSTVTWKVSEKKKSWKSLKKKLKQETETKDEHYWEPYRPYQQLTEKPVHTSDNSDKDTASEASSITDPENTESDPASSTK